MKKIVYLVCGMLTLYLIVENANFIYAENENTQLIVEDGELLANIDINDVEDENKIEEMPINYEEINEKTNEETVEPSNQNLDSLDKGNEIQIFYAEQTGQYIDTSNYGIIRIKDPNNTWKWITILDRNLWAAATWAWVDESRKSFWYYYQWWNNYWFPSDPNATIISGNTQVDASEYWPGTDNWYYSSDTFIKWNNDWSSVRNDNLWWWSGDSRDGNGRWYPVTNPEDRQWPCPDGYHVPSIWERSKLLEFWAWEYSGVSIEIWNYWLLYFENTGINEFFKRFYIPAADQRDRDSLIIANGWSLLRSSSPDNISTIFRLFWNKTSIFATSSNHRVSAFPVRCFYNSYRLPVIITYDVNWWYWDDDVSNQQKVITYTKEDDDSDFSGNIALWSVKRDANCWESGNKRCIFGWWYTLTGDEMRTWNISEDITLVAKWLAYDDKDISYSGVNFTIMDRNLGSETSWTGENAYGYYLTWWENDIMCPEWYHIPSTWEWLWIKKLLSGEFNSDSIKDLLNLPFAGKIVNNEVIETEGNGYYLAKDWNEIRYAKISDSDIVIGDLNEWEKVSARCFKNYNTWTIKFDSKGWNNISDITAVNWREDGKKLLEPNREHSIFLWWYDENNVKLEKNINYKNEEEIWLSAKWECENWYQENENKCEAIPKKSGWSSGWGGGWNKKDFVILSGTKLAQLSWVKSEESSTWNTLQIDSYADKSVSELQWDWERISPTHLDRGNQKTTEWNNIKGFSQEFIDAYNFAYKNWITTKSPIENAKMFSPLTRIQMAKMLSNYAINVLWKHPDISKWTIKFDDVSNKLNREYDNAVNLAYQLWIMWQNIKNDKFRPYDEVTRAEFSTALSRLLYWTKDGETKYYEPHMNKLYNEWVINKTNPDIKEKRWYIIIMLMRTITWN